MQFTEEMLDDLESEYDWCGFKMRIATRVVNTSHCLRSFDRHNKALAMQSYWSKQREITKRMHTLGKTILQSDIAYL